ncbi:MAG: glycosyltransferase family 2 protein [Paludibacteraceae bacterium]|nr:glycosyltransferase family 2 protein [Paludibacteraceae bacterium]
MNKILVIIVTYNGMQWIERCINSVLESSVPADIYVVDNGSTDGTQNFIRDHYDNVIFHQSNLNLGFGRANNIGFKYAIENNYDYLYLLNQDAWIEKFTFEILIASHRENPQYGVISPLQCNASETRFDNNFYCNCLSNAIVYNHLKKTCQPTDLYECDFVMAAHWLISRNCVLHVGGFSPSFPHYGEDNNFIHRCLFHGFKVGISFNTFGIHDREYRVEAKSKVLYMQYIDSIINISNPIEKRFSISKYCESVLKYVVKYKSFIPFLYLFKFLKRKRDFLDNKEKSIEGCAFL